MKKILRVFIALMIFSEAYGQAQTPEGFDKASYSVSFMKSFPTGSYKNYLQSIDDPASTFGATFIYMVNPYKKRQRSSQLFVGGELGVQGNKQKDIINQYGGNFYVSYTEIWLNTYLRYRPVLWSSIVNPYVDVFAGPKVFNARIMENVSDEEQYKIDKMNSVALNYGVGAGVGIRASREGEAAKYIDLGVYINGSNPVRQMDRKSVLVNSAAEVYFEKKVVTPNQVQVKLGFTGFL